jgi:hypothetical protein
LFFHIIIPTDHLRNEITKEISKTDIVKEEKEQEDDDIISPSLAPTTTAAAAAIQKNKLPSSNIPSSISIVARDVSVVRQYEEPPAFKKLFHGWCPWEQFDKEVIIGNFGALLNTQTNIKFPFISANH